MKILNIARTVNHATEYVHENILPILRYGLYGEPYRRILAQKYAANFKCGSYSEPYHGVCARQCTVLLLIQGKLVFLTIFICKLNLDNQHRVVLLLEMSFLIALLLQLHIFLHYVCWKPLHSLPALPVSKCCLTFNIVRFV